MKDCSNNMNERDLQTTLLDFLVLEKSYPREALRQGLSIGGDGKNYRVDIGLLDLRRNEIVGLFEVKSSRKGRPLREAVSQLLQYKRALGKNNVPAYLVFPPIETSSLDFEIVQVLDDGDTVDVYRADFPKYDTLIASDSASLKSERTRKVSTAVDRFKFVSFALAAITLLLLLLDVLNIFTATAQQLILGAVIIGLVLLPYAAKFKMLGVEFERYKPEEKP